MLAADMLAACTTLLSFTATSILQKAVMVFRESVELNHSNSTLQCTVDTLFPT